MAAETPKNTFDVCYYYPTTNSFSRPIKTFDNLDAAIAYAKIQAPMDTGIFDDNHDSPRWTSF